MKLVIGVTLLTAVYVIAWHQLYGQFISDFYKKYENYLILLSIPCTWMSIKAVALISDHFNGKMWPNRMFTFGIGIIMFTTLTTYYFDEKLSMKTVILLGLSCLIVILQAIWK